MDSKKKEEKSYTLTFTKNDKYTINGLSVEKFIKTYKESESFFISDIKPIGNNKLPSKIKVEGTENYIYSPTEGLLAIKKAPKKNIVVSLDVKEIKNEGPLRFTVVLPRTYIPEDYIVGITSEIHEGQIYESRWSDTEIDALPIHTYKSSTRQELIFNVEITFNYPPDAIGMTGRKDREAPGNAYLTRVTIPSGIKYISNFSYATNLKSVYIEGNDLERIYGSAFKFCDNLESINIPYSVYQIDGEAFQNCRSLKKIVLPEAIGYLANELFDGCESLEEVNIPQHITSIPGPVFRNCQSLRHIDIPPFCTIIESNAFSGCHSLESITLPAGIPWIGDATFAGTYSLKEIFIPRSCHHMEANAFKGSGIETITFEQGSQMTYIRDNAFENCKNLKHFRVPSNLDDLSERAFVNCNLESCSVSERNRRFTSRDYIGPYGEMGEVNAIIEGNTIVHGSNTTVINADFSHITDIGDWAFSGRERITELDVRKIDWIGASSFENAISINNLNFENLDLDLNESRFLNCFRNCTLLTNLVLGRNIYHNLCEGANNLKTVDIRSDTDTIGNFAFNGCVYLEKINFEELENLRKIGNFAFGNCKSLQSVSIPASVENISTGAFYNSGLNLIQVDPENYYYSDDLNGVKGAIIKRVADPSPYPLIVQACKTTEIEDNDSYFGIASYSFAGITYDQGTQLIMPRNTLRIDDYAYCNSSNCSITISENVKYMGEKVFAGWKENQTIRIPNSIVESVGSSGFKIARWLNNTWSLTPINYIKGKNATYISEDCGSSEAHIEIY